MEERAFQRSFWLVLKVITLTWSRQMNCSLRCVSLGSSEFSSSSDEEFFSLTLFKLLIVWVVQTSVGVWFLQVKLTVFWQYVKAVSPVISLVICFLYCCQNAAAIGANVWLSDWTNEPVINGTQHNTAMRIGVYAALGLLQGETR